MPRVIQVVTTPNFAGTERHVCTAASGISGRGWDVAVVGGERARMRAELPPEVEWQPGATAAEAIRSLRSLGAADVCHVHMTYAEALAVAARPFHRAPIVTTRHFAAARGSSRLGRFGAPWIAGRVSREIAVSEFVAESLERPPDAVIPSAVPASPLLWTPGSRAVLVLQRLEVEKDTLTALRAWQASELAGDGWALRVIGSGSQQLSLEEWAYANGLRSVSFLPWTPNVASEFANAGMLLATTPREAFGLSVVEAMAAGVPVVAAAGGGHLETVGRLLEPALFAPGDAVDAGARLRQLADELPRAAASAASRELAEREFSVECHVNRLLVEYKAAIEGRPSRRRASTPHTRSARRRSRAATGDGLKELVVCSLEAWDEIWRRNQFFTDILLRRNPDLRVLFVEPPADPLFDIASRKAPTLPRLRTVSHDGRLRAFRPLKPLPRKLGRLADRALLAQVLTAARVMRLREPTLWLNDVTYAPLIERAGWPTVYDITDDWLLIPSEASELERQRELNALALRAANEVVVCSPALAESRGLARPVSLIPNGVDVEHFTRLRSRPHDLPPAPVAVYVGSLHDARIDVDLVVELARELPQLNLAFVGPNSLSTASTARLEAEPNVLLIGPRRYEDVPAYLQHADVVVVPHLVSAFTESLDPIKAYECLAIDTPTVATPVAGFRNLRSEFCIVDRGLFANAVAKGLAVGFPRDIRTEPPSWESRTSSFESALLRTLATRP